MKRSEAAFNHKNHSNRRSLIKNGMLVAGGATAGAGLLAHGLPVFGQEEGPEERSGRLTPGDAAILRFLAAAEILESDLWVQYNELGGIQDNELPELGGTGNAPYTNALAQLDEDMPQYIHDNTEDEITHFQFINAYLASKAAAYKSHAAHCGHQLVDPVPQPRQQP